MWWLQSTKNKTTCRPRSSGPGPGPPTVRDSFWGPLRTGFAFESGQISDHLTFLNLRSLNLCTSHILGFGCLHGQDVVGL